MEQNTLMLATQIVELVSRYHNSLIPTISLVLSCVSIILGIASILFAWLIYNNTVKLSQEAQTTIQKTASSAEMIQKDIREIIVKTLEKSFSIPRDGAEDAAEKLFPGVMQTNFKKSTSYTIVSNTQREGGDIFIFDFIVNKDTLNPSVSIRLSELNETYQGITAVLEDKNKEIACKANFIQESCAQVSLYSQKLTMIPSGTYRIRLELNKKQLLKKDCD